MSDLQCPARIFWLRDGVAATERVVTLLRPERLVAVYGPGQAPDLEELADRHRGEAVLVVGEHPHGSPLVLVELDADGTRTTPWELPGGDASG